MLSYLLSLQAMHIFFNLNYNVIWQNEENLLQWCPKDIELPHELCIACFHITYVCAFELHYNKDITLHSQQKMYGTVVEIKKRYSTISMIYVVGDISCYTYLS